MKGKSYKPAADTIAYYDANADAYIERTRGLNLSALYERFLKHIPSQGKILDAGCGSGRDLKAFAEKGYLVLGIDASTELVSKAHDYPGAICQVQSFESITWTQEFDGIWACASLLHVHKADIIDVLIRLKNALKPGGVLYISVREGDDENWLPDGRYFANYSSKEFFSLVDKVERFYIIDYWRSKDIRSDHEGIWWLNFIIKRTGA